MARNRVIGREGKIPWHLPEDFRWFKKMTTGQTILMGRKTFESLGRPLPNRTNVVVTRHAAPMEGVTVVRDLKAFNPEDYPGDVWVIGGAEIYGQMLARCEDLYLSLVAMEMEGDAVFPVFEDQFKLVGTVLRHEEFEVLHYRNLRADAPGSLLRGAETPLPGPGPE